MSDAAHDKMDSEALKRALRRGDFAAAREMVAARGQPPELAAPPTAEAVSLAEACGTAETEIDGCGVTVVRRAIQDYFPFPTPHELAVQRDCARIFRGARQRFDEIAASPALCHAADAGAEDILLVTAETVGATDPVIFLVGIMYLQSGRLMIEQYLARDEGQEKGVLKALALLYGAAAVAATFGSGRGKRSIHKALLARCSLHGVGLLSDAWEAPQRQTGDEGPVHLDLRKECRSRWGRTGGNLRTLEKVLLARPRGLSLPRRDTAGAYREFLATGNAADVGDILRHNALDLVAMAAALCRLLTGCDLGDTDA